MEEKEFAALVDELEDFAHRNPGEYKMRVALLAALGYAFLLATVVVIVVLVGVIAYFLRFNWLLIKILFIPLGLAAVVLRSLWVKFPEPDGLTLRYEDAPRLFDVARSIRKATKGPRLHKILLTDKSNAGIVQRPRLGLFGWHENYLMVGLPLLRGLSNVSVKDEFKYHEVAPEVVRELRDRLRNYPDLAIAYLLQKAVHHFPQEPGYVLGVVTEGRTWYGRHNDAGDHALVDKSANEVTFPGFTFIRALEHQYKSLRKVFERVQGSEIYPAAVDL